MIAQVNYSWFLFSFSPLSLLFLMNYSFGYTNEYTVSIRRIYFSKCNFLLNLDYLSMYMIALLSLLIEKLIFLLMAMI